MGIKTVMVTGDNRLTAAAIAAEAGVDDFLAEVRAHLPASLQRRIVREVKRDLVDLPRGDLRARVATALRPGFNRRPSPLP
jgi:magnesium-transporting ATPase (P-type)